MRKLKYNGQIGTLIIVKNINGNTKIKGHLLESYYLKLKFPLMIATTMYSFNIEVWRIPFFEYEKEQINSMVHEM